MFVMASNMKDAGGGGLHGHRPLVNLGVRLGVAPNVPSPCRLNMMRHHLQRVRIGRHLNMGPIRKLKRFHVELLRKFHWL
jgi:hypothetical protein